MGCCAPAERRPALSACRTKAQKRPSGGAGGSAQPCENIVVAYYFCGEPIPYRTLVKGRVVTLSQFKELLTKKGNYRCEGDGGGDGGSVGGCGGRRDGPPAGASPRPPLQPCPKLCPAGSTSRRSAMNLTVGWCLRRCVRTRPSCPSSRRRSWGKWRRSTSPGRRPASDQRGRRAPFAHGGGPSGCGRAALVPLEPLHRGRSGLPCCVTLDLSTLACISAGGDCWGGSPVNAPMPGCLGESGVPLGIYPHPTPRWSPELCGPVCVSGSLAFSPPP